MIKNIRHSGIVVNDLEASLHFYREMLGFEIVKQMDESGDYINQVLGLCDTNVTTVKMAAPDGQIIELLYYHSHPGEPKPREICDIGISHIAFTVDDLNSEYERLSSEGVEFICPPQLSPDGHVKVAFCRAPERTFVELVEVLR